MFVIIGASKGLGKSLYSDFYENDLLLISRTKIETKKENHHHLQIDINNFDYSILKKYIDRKKIKGIFFTVGIVSDNDNFNLSNKDKDNILNTNFNSITKINEYLIKNNAYENNCLICFCSSVTTFLPRSKQVIYCASKNALDSYFLSFRSYCKNKKLNLRTCNLILGFIETDMNKGKKTFFPKKNPDEISHYIKNYFKTLNGKKYIPFYWLFIKIILILTPNIIKNFLINKLNI
tara:strand:- start:31016 stop:31720 length:705 start_codon:yes stop_codon:yes gene_type:complete